MWFWYILYELLILLLFLITLWYVFEHVGTKLFGFFFSSSDEFEPNRRSKIKQKINRFTWNGHLAICLFFILFYFFSYFFCTKFTFWFFIFFYLADYADYSFFFLLLLNLDTNVYAIRLMKMWHTLIHTYKHIKKRCFTIDIRGHHNNIPKAN